ncbi:MAG: hypothetical protein PHE27_05360 [Alphaproteobacteria bacterium]|nr:hypothetical protein [Alphaproteobacteria bacterium]
MPKPQYAAYKHLTRAGTTVGDFQAMSAQEFAGLPLKDKILDLSCVMGILSHRKKQGIEESHVHPLLRKVYAQAAQKLAKRSPECGRALCAYDPRPALEEIFSIVEKEPFALTGLGDKEQISIGCSRYDLPYFSGSKEEREKSGNQMLVYDSIAQRHTPETIDFLKQAAIRANRMMFASEEAELLTVERNIDIDVALKKKACRLAAEIHFKALGIDRPFEVSFCEKRNKRANASWWFDETRNVNMIEVYDIEKSTIPALAKTVGHESVHAWEYYTKGQIDDWTTSSFVFNTFGNSENYFKLARERIAYGYGEYFFGKFFETIAGIETDRSVKEGNRFLSDFAFSSADEYFEDDLHPKDTSHATQRLKALSSRLTFICPSKAILRFEQSDRFVCPELPGSSGERSDARKGLAFHPL